MIQLSTTDYYVLLGYFSLICFLSIIFRAKRFKQVFGEEKKPNWLLLSASLLMIEWSPIKDMMSMGLILENGYSSIWMLKSSFWVAGVPAILFAAMWSRMKFQTDNELIRLRFSGGSGKFLHIFRAIFLSIFAIPIFASFILVALRKLLVVLNLNLPISDSNLLVICVLLLVFKNSFHQKIRTDALTAVVCLSAPVVICFFLVNHHGGINLIYEQLAKIAYTETRLLPEFNQPENSTVFGDFIVFILIQWWSVTFVDNSNPNAQRHLQAKSQFAAFRALFIPIVITSLMFLFISTIWDCGLLEYKLGELSGVDTEGFYLQVALQYLPDGFKAFVLIAILFSFLTTFESIINWGGGLLTVDVIKQYLIKRGTDRQYKYISFSSMLLLSSISLYYAFNSDQILTLQKFVFSISAGVAPVFMLRWFWWRINAWTQLSAMLSSLIYTLSYDHLYQTNEGVRLFLETLGTNLGVSAYPLKISILTFMVVSTWLTVTFCTKPDEDAHLRKFVRLTGTGGFWPKGYKQENYELPKRVGLCLLFAIGYILPFVFIWQFKFGSNVIAWIMLFIFIVIIMVVYRSMKFLLQDKIV